MFYLCLNFILYMKNFSKVMLSIIFTTLIVGSVQSVLADEHRLGLQPVRVDAVTDLFKPVPIRNSEYQFHLQVVVRDSHGQLVSVTESTNGWTTVALPGKMITGIVIVDNKQVMTNLTDNVFNKEVEKEIIAVDDIKYEKVQWVDTKSSCEDESCKDIHQNVGKWNTNFFGDFNEFGFLNIPLFQALTSTVIMEEDDNVTNQWTVLRAMDE